jgi:hypothetical protein
MIAGLQIVWMVLNVGFRLATILEKHPPANGMESKPLVIIYWCSQFVFNHQYPVQQL